MNVVNHTLAAAELHAERAGLQELRVRIDTVRALSSRLDDEGLAHARALLLKLSRLVAEETVASA